MEQGNEQTAFHLFEIECKSKRSDALSYLEGKKIHQHEGDTNNVNSSPSKIHFLFIQPQNKKQFESASV